MSSTAQTVTWHTTDNVRSTYSVLISCIATLIICVWSALHLNVPTYGSRLKQRNLRRTKWICLGIFAPELVVATAFAQYLTACWLQREISKDVEYRKAKTAPETNEIESEKWSITQCYFATMGGVMIQADGDGFDKGTHLTLTPEGVRLLSFLGHLPNIQESQIRDKSKADGLAKSIVILQASWMIIQVIGRLASRMPVTLLEINTVGHVLCALVLYLLWWRKPLEVKDPVILSLEPWMSPYLALMYMCSRISATDEVEITEMRCITYRSPQQRRAIVIKDPTAVNDKDLNELKDEPSPHETHFSVGSWATRDPERFIGPLGRFSVGSVVQSPLPSPYDHHVMYMVSESDVQIAAEHQLFFDLQNDKTPLRHSMVYCRRALKDCKSHEPLTPFAIQRWRLACSVIDDLWEECQNRPSYERFYFTVSSLGLFIGETNYIATHIPNFLGLSYLGHVNIHRDYLKSALAFAAAAYGALHVAAWNEYFPTKPERVIWIVSSMAIGSSGVFLWMFFLIKQKIEVLDKISVYVKSSKILAVVTRATFAVFALARIYLVVEAFVSLRRVPQDVYNVPSWSDYIPHF